MRKPSKAILKCIAVLALLLNIVAEANADPIKIIDQQNLGPFAGTSGGVIFGQSFTPTLPGIDAIEFLMAGDNDIVVVQILDGVVGFDGLGGPVIAISNPVVVNTPGFHQTIHFDFTTTVSLVPGQTYVARLFTPGGIEGVSLTDDVYGGGQFLAQGFAIGRIPSFDMIFTEGLHTNTAVPEPATLVLFSVGMGGLVIKRLRRSV
jgi:PEP-CTERM motif